MKTYTEEQLLSICKSVAEKASGGCSYDKDYIKGLCDYYSDHEQKTMIKFNINHYILIQITDAGWLHLRDTLDESYIKNCITPYRQILNDNEVWYRLQAHNVFSLLPMNTGFNKVLYNTNILIDVDSD
jgi:hypothetical protein